MSQPSLAPSSAVVQLSLTGGSHATVASAAAAASCGVYDPAAVAHLPSALIHAFAFWAAAPGLALERDKVSALELLESEERRWHGSPSLFSSLLPRPLLEALSFDLSRDVRIALMRALSTAAFLHPLDRARLWRLISPRVTFCLNSEMATVRCETVRAMCNLFQSPRSLAFDIMLPDNSVVNIIFGNLRSSHPGLLTQTLTLIAAFCPYKSYAQCIADLNINLAALLPVGAPVAGSGTTDAEMRRHYVALTETYTNAARRAIMQAQPSFLTAPAADAPAPSKESAAAELAQAKGIVAAAARGQDPPALLSQSVLSLLPAFLAPHHGPYVQFAALSALVAAFRTGL